MRAIGVIGLLGLITGLVSCSDPIFEAAERAEAKNETTLLTEAIRLYRMEYGRLPVATPPEGDVTLDTNEGALIDVISGYDVNGLNPRERVFYEGKKARNGVAGIVASQTTGHQELIDPWGRPYVLVFDTNDDGLVIDPVSGESLRETVIAFSFGELIEDHFDNHRSWE
jgi:hypothetical protein